MVRTPTKDALAACIDHTLLRQDTTRENIEKLCREAVEYGFFGVCVPPYFVSAARTFLQNTGVRIVTVAGFPFGYNTMSAKVEETKKAIIDGANEIDFVINIGALKSGSITYLREEIESITTICRLQNRIVKVIIEAAMLTDAELQLVCELCVAAGVDFVKTSTGFSQAGGASLEMVQKLRNLLPKNIRIKASGGIRDAAFAIELLNAGASRIGTSSGMDMINSL